MPVSLRLVCLTGLLVSVLAIPAAADQGRRDHDTPATERQSDPISARQYTARGCRTNDYGWVVCEHSAQWWRDENQRHHRGYSNPDSIGDLIGRLFRL